MKSLQKSQSLSPEPPTPDVSNGHHSQDDNTSKMTNGTVTKRSRSDSCVLNGNEVAALTETDATDSLSSRDVQLAMSKLRGLVHVPQDKELTKLELMQCVIDYIADLESSLKDGL